MSSYQYLRHRADPRLRSGPFSMADETMARGDDEGRGYDRSNFAGQRPVLVGRMSTTPSLPVAIARRARSPRSLRARGIEADEIEAALAAANTFRKSADGVVMDSSSWVISRINPR